MTIQRSTCPGGYSEKAAEVVRETEFVLFANENLVRSELFSEKKRFGMGYYPIQQAEKLASRRAADHVATRTAFLAKQGIADHGQRILVYFGGNNEDYFLNAFPAFLSIMAESSQWIDNESIIVVVQQHPAAKAKNRDVKQIASYRSLPRIIVSDFSSDEAQVLADAALYYQTSMAPQFILEGIPTIQIGHKTYEDVLIRNALAPSVTSSADFIRILQRLDDLGKRAREDLLDGLGIKVDWADRLEHAIQELANSRAYQLPSGYHVAFGRTDTETLCN